MSHLYWACFSRSSSWGHGKVHWMSSSFLFLPTCPIFRLGTWRPAGWLFELGLVFRPFLFGKGILMLSLPVVFIYMFGVISRLDWSPHISFKNKLCQGCASHLQFSAFSRKHPILQSDCNQCRPVILFNISSVENVPLLVIFMGSVSSL